MKLKILAHIIAISCFLVGGVILHVILNHNTDFFYFFNILLHKAMIFDSALVLIGIAFFTEFYMSFKPIKIT